MYKVCDVPYKTVLFWFCHTSRGTAGLLFYINMAAVPDNVLQSHGSLNSVYLISL